MSDVSFSDAFSAALRGEPCQVVGLYQDSRDLPVHEWTREPDPVDLAMLGLCVGPTLDIGCGPGRMAARLAETGAVVLGIDVVPEAVAQTRTRGASALLRDVFDHVPGEGRWCTALLADGNVGIGGDPVALLRRVRELLDPRGRIVVELAAPGVAAQVTWAQLECAGARSKPFRWAVIGMDDAGSLATDAGLVVAEQRQWEGRWVVVMEEAA